MKVISGDRLAPYRKAVEERICTVCNDRDLHGHCTRDAANPCSLMQHLDLIVDSVLSVGESADIGDYLTAVRLKTCPHCREDSRGFCALRGSVDCATDSYMMMIVDVIEDVAREQQHGKWAVPSRA